MLSFCEDGLQNSPVCFCLKRMYDVPVLGRCGLMINKIVEQEAAADRVRVYTVFSIMCLL